MFSDISSAEQLFKLLNFLKDISGLRINCKKTEGMWIGSTKENKAKRLGIKWPNEPIKALGVYYMYMYNNMMLNFSEKRTLLKDWIALKNLSIFGPQEVHPCMVS